LNTENHHADCGALTVRVGSDGALLTIAVSGELDLSTAEKLERELRVTEAMVAQDVVIDLSGLSFLDSTGLVAVLAGVRRLEGASKSVSVRRGDGYASEVLGIAGLESILRFID
jgi:anti-anti-sigma factor